VLDTLDAAAVRRWCGGGLASLRAHQQEIDELNVYPVPDGDTGTNLVLTLTSAQEAMDAPESTGRQSADAEPAASAGNPLSRAMRRMARGALLGARGNSGVIVSQILRGMADAFAGSVAVRGGELARALRSASEAAYASVARPVEGTVLSVVAAAADGAGRIASDDLVVVARAAARSATEALARTPQQLPVLAAAGVVDAGGRGLCLLLDALVEALSVIGPGEPVVSDTCSDTERPVGAIETERPVGVLESERPDPASEAGQPAAVAGADPGRPALSTQTPADSASSIPAGSAEDPSPGATNHDFGYEVQYLLDARPAEVDALRQTLDALGDSLVVVGTGDGDPPTWNVHVHVEDIGAAIEAGIAAGRPHKISVTRLEDRIHSHEPSGSQPIRQRRVDDPPVHPDRRGAVVVAAGDGLTALLAAEGATVVGRNPSIAEMLAAIDSTGAGYVVLLPNDANTHAVATAAAREAAASGVRVSVVPTRSPVQALAALAVRDPARYFADDVIAMAEAAGACRYGEVCTASREALTVAGRCRPGDLLGLVDGEVHVIGADLDEVCRRLLDRMLGGGGELVTLVLGADAPGGLEDALSAHVNQTWPFVELQCYTGGQPRYHLLVGVE
jgi:DAK2 domain fusion protein YloV